ncbi:hypothetical protein NEOLEDRAFT_1176156 [Neolentinus lepideus HHB14362 ss-1]|uniref:Uncharacterized protein n=1 Tax=Neolentinus lepideus HHB14362 ss-1 TaxID=1314782 RepID=A0A165UDD9_9AGAM|nr:hypothetical protein NEOLEDRAFT_1176156 [Neolentinus lepideus HHB14362 ss-1]
MTTEIDILNTVIPGSRQPIRIAPSPDSSDSGLSSSPSASRANYSSISSVRRKPRVTYQSPSCTHPTALRIEPPSGAPTSTPSSIASRQSATQVTNKLKSKSNDDKKKEEKEKSRVKSMGPPLPLYHPLGRLALSLPELDPELFGLPNTFFNITVDDASRRASARTRRPAAKLRDASEDNTAPASPPDEAEAVAEKVTSPRKRRGGGKRKRKDPDDGDSTYPAKRMRNPRSATATAVQDEDVEGEHAEGEEPLEEKKPERRSRRTRAVVTRRNSSGSEATTRSASISVRKERMEVDVPTEEAEVPAEEVEEKVVAPVESAEQELGVPEPEPEPMEVVSPGETPAQAASEKEPGPEKEEGELSEEPEDRRSKV